MLDIGKLIQIAVFSVTFLSFSSMLDIGKLIYKPRRTVRCIRFGSMLDIGKLIRCRPSGQK